MSDSGATPATEREAAYVNAVRILFGSGRQAERDFEYAEAMRRLHERYPEDNEAAAFYALALLGTAHGGRDFRIYMQAAAIAEGILANNPEHPGALHYAIHAYDDPVHAPLGLRAALKYAKVAPESSHALHMPSHIFFATGRWDEAAASNEAAFRASERTAGVHGESMEAAGYHALWWLQYAYLQQGRVADARRTLGKMAALARVQASPIARFHLVQMKAMLTVETGEPFDAAADLTGLDVSAAAAHHFAAGSAALNAGDRPAADRALVSLRALGSASSGSGHDAHGSHLLPSAGAVAAIAGDQLAAMIAMTDGKSREAVALMKAAVSAEEKMPYEFGPPSPVKPAHELLGEMLLSLNEPKLARVQFQLALLRAPKRALSMLGLARSLEQMNDREGAVQAYRELLEMWARADAAVRSAVEDSLKRIQSATAKTVTP